MQTPLPSGFLLVKLVTFLLPHQPQPVHDYDITHRFVSFTYSQPHPLCNNTIRTRLTPLPHFQHQIPPVFKSGHKNVVTNYRGVALPILSKVLERSVQSRILNLIGPHLSPSQHGFRKYRSCVKQLRHYVHNLATSLDAGEQTELVTSTKLLGLTIASDLTWNEHVTEITKKASKRLYFLTQLKRARAPKQDLAMFYVSCVRSVIDYAAPVFFNSLPQYLKNGLRKEQYQ